jgi:hypothetical protein
VPLAQTQESCQNLFVHEGASINQKVEYHNLSLVDNTHSEFEIVSNLNLDDSAFIGLLKYFWPMN